MRAAAVLAMLDNGYILLHRSLLKWEWYTDANTKALFLHLLLTVNYEDKRWRGMVIRRGQRVCSRDTLAKETKLSVRSVRTALEHLKSTGEVTSQKSPQGTVVTVVRYDFYQTPTSESTNDRPTTDQRPTSDRPELNKEQESKKKEKEDSCAFERFWELYPKKKSKGDALKAWTDLSPDSELAATILQKVAEARTCRDWTKEQGRYIPYPATWLRRMGWEDELSPAAPAYEETEGSL